LRVKTMRSLSDFFAKQFSRTFKIAFTVVFLLVNLTVVVVNTLYINHTVEEQNESLVEMVEHLIEFESEEAALTYMEHYGHTHQVFLRYESDERFFETKTAPEDDARYNIEIVGQKVGELTVDNAQSNLTLSNMTYLLSVNAVLIVIFLFSLIGIDKALKKNNDTILRDVHSVLQRTRKKEPDVEYSFDDFARIDEALSEAFSKLSRLREEHKRNIEALAHDIKTPLTVVTSLTEGVFQGRIERSEEVKTSILEETKRINDLVEKIIEGDADEADETIDLSGLLHERLSLHQPLFDKKEQALRKNIAQGVALRAKADELKRLIDHLLLNAHQYSPESAGISVSLSKNPVRFMVKDEGEGIDESLKKKIFTSRLDSGGSGVGLLIVKRIVDKMQGEIELKSEKGKGTTVIVTFDS